MSGILQPSRIGRNSKVSPNWLLDPFRASAEVRQFNPTPLHLCWHSWNSGSGGQRLEDPPLISPRAHSGVHCCAELLTAWAGSLDEMGREGVTCCEAGEEAAAEGPNTWHFSVMTDSLLLCYAYPSSTSSCWTDSMSSHRCFFFFFFCFLARAPPQSTHEKHERAALGFLEHFFFLNWLRDSEAKNVLCGFYGKLMFLLVIFQIFYRNSTREVVIDSICQSSRVFFVLWPDSNIAPCLQPHHTLVFDSLHLVHIKLESKSEKEFRRKDNFLPGLCVCLFFSYLHIKSYENVCLIFLQSAFI